MPTRHTTSHIQPNAPEFGALVLRVGLGALFLAHAWLKIAVFTIPGTVQFFASLGLPAIAAYGTILIELVGGVLLILGVASRLVSLAMLPVLAGSILFVHGDKGWLFSNEGGGWEFPAFLIVASLAQVFLGNGALSLGTLLGERMAPAGASGRLARAVVS
ncbi:MAG: DoxX family membrane protein [Rhizobiales bacterium]|nr:DoxX family membrane protein [Hyphomicrobiales bacterium]